MIALIRVGRGESLCCLRMRGSGMIQHADGGVSFQFYLAWGIGEDDRQRKSSQQFTSVNYK